MFGEDSVDHIIPLNELEDEDIRCCKTNFLLWVQMVKDRTGLIDMSRIRVFRTINEIASIIEPKRYDKDFSYKTTVEPIIDEVMKPEVDGNMLFLDIIN